MTARPAAGEKRKEQIEGGLPDLSGRPPLCVSLYELLWPVYGINENDSWRFYKQSIQEKNPFQQQIHENSGFLHLGIDKPPGWNDNEAKDSIYVIKVRIENLKRKGGMRRPIEARKPTLQQFVSEV